MTKLKKRTYGYTCNRCGMIFRIDHEVAENGALCTPCFKMLVKGTHDNTKTGDQNYQFYKEFLNL